MSQPENKLLQELDNVVKYAQSCVGKKLLDLVRNNRLDISNKDASVITSELNLALEQVYKDFAQSFSRLKTEIREQREELVKQLEAKKK